MVNKVLEFFRNSKPAPPLDIARRLDDHRNPGWPFFMGVSVIGMIRTRKVAGMAAVVMVVAGGHLVWFLVFGPPARWGSGVEDVAPKFPGLESPAAAPYAAAQGIDSSSSDLLGEVGQSSGVVGRVLHCDEVAEVGYSVLQTHAGRYWSPGPTPLFSPRTLRRLAGVSTASPSHRRQSEACPPERPRLRAR